LWLNLIIDIMYSNHHFEKEHGVMKSKQASFRIERDSMGEVKVPKGAYFGAQTQRAVDNFPISGLRFPPPFVRALGLVKWASARANGELGLLEVQLVKAILEASQEVIDGRWDDQFVLDIFQTGSGTSTNMNANEVIANRANELLGAAIGKKSPVHPNDHVNLCQSSNDVIPTAIHVVASELLDKELLPVLRELHRALMDKSQAFDDVVKVGRTHLQDALPIRLGQEFSGYARQVAMGVQRIERSLDSLFELTLGGTAVGTLFNVHPDFPKRAIGHMGEKTGLPFRETANHFEAQAGKDALVETSGALKTVAVGFIKMANDIRWLGSGPRCGLGEIYLPETQPGSSMMPGKVNPVIAESIIQIGAQVIGNDLVITLGGQGGNFELNAMMPVMTYSLIQSIQILASGGDNFRKKCIEGLRADERRCRQMVEQSLALATALVPEIGYDRAAEIAKKASASHKTIKEVAEEEGLLPEERLDSLLDPRRMTKGGIPK
jgi:fumarate hydratase class II